MPGKTHRHWTLLRRLATVAAAVAALLWTGGLASAQPAGPSGLLHSARAGADPASGTVSAVARLTDGSRVNSLAAARKVQRYWTADRMRRAISVPDSPDLGAITARISRQLSGRAGSYPGARPKGMSADATINESAVVGKVFFHNPNGQDESCSASALNSPSHQLVITAGHCVHQGNGGTWMQNWTFVPRYRNGARPFGTFAAKQFRTFDVWINNGDKGRDVGMVTTWPLDGRKLVDVVGGNGLNWNWPHDVFVTILAYPSNHDNGELQWWCQGTTGQVSIFDNRIQLNCNFGPGASGGPWLMSFDNNTGLGQVDGVCSTETSDGTNRSPYFDDGVKAMFDAQGSVT